VFTATSAVCVTGLVTVDTGTSWSTFGHLVILGLMQVGGLGIMTVASLLVVLVSRRLGLRARLVAQAQSGSLDLSDVRRVLRNVVLFSLVGEAPDRGGAGWAPRDGLRVGAGRRQDAADDAGSPAQGYANVRVYGGRSPELTPIITSLTEALTTCTSAGYWPSYSSVAEIAGRMSAGLAIHIAAPEVAGSRPPPATNPNRYDR